MKHLQKQIQTKILVINAQCLTVFIVKVTKYVNNVTINIYPVKQVNHAYYAKFKDVDIVQNKINVYSVKQVQIPK